MRPQTLAAFLLLAAAPLLGQEPAGRAPGADPLAAGRQKLRDALTKAANTADTAFDLTWSDGTKKNDNQAIAVFLGGRAGNQSTTGRVQGSWHRDLTHIASLEGSKDELLLAGRRLLAKDATTDWVLRAHRTADGNDAGFLPDVQLLLEQLAAWDLAVVQRAVGSLDDRPIEIFSITLNPDQVADAAFGDLLPDALLTNANPFAQLVRMQVAGNAARPPAPRPESTVDLAIFVDPATGTVHELRFRTWTKQDERFAGAARGVVVRNGVVQQVGPGDEEEEEEKEDAAKSEGPLRYVDGLPERKRSKMIVRDCVLKLAGHGRTAAPELTQTQRRLLGLQPR